MRNQVITYLRNLVVTFSGMSRLGLDVKDLEALDKNRAHEEKELQNIRILRPSKERELAKEMSKGLEVDDKKKEPHDQQLLNELGELRSNNSDRDKDSGSQLEMQNHEPPENPGQDTDSEDPIEPEDSSNSYEDNDEGSNSEEVIN